MDKRFDHLQEQIAGYDLRLRTMETREAGCAPLMNSRVDAAWRKIEEHVVELKALSRVVAELQHSNKILTWLGGLMGSALILWLITQLLGMIK